MRQGWRIAFAILTTFMLGAAAADEPASRIDLDDATIAALDGEWFWESRSTPSADIPLEDSERPSFFFDFRHSGGAYFSSDGVCVARWVMLASASRQGAAIAFEDQEGEHWTVRLLPDGDRVEHVWMSHGETYVDVYRRDTARPVSIELSDATVSFLSDTPPFHATFREAAGDFSFLTIDLLSPLQAYLTHRSGRHRLNDSWAVVRASERDGIVELDIADREGKPAGTLHLIREGDAVRVVEWNAVFARRVRDPAAEHPH